MRRLLPRVPEETDEYDDDNVNLPPIGGIARRGRAAHRPASTASSQSSALSTLTSLTTSTRGTKRLEGTKGNAPLIPQGPLPTLLEYVQANASKPKDEAFFDLAFMKRLVQEKKGSLHEKEESFGYTPLATVCCIGNDSAVACLIDLQASLDTTCNLGNTPLHLAARGGQASTVQLLVAKKASLDATNHEGWTPMIWAAMSGHVEATHALIDAKAEVEIQDNEGLNAMMWATRHGHAEVTKSFVALGPDLSTLDYSGHDVLYHSRNHRTTQKMLARYEELNRKLMKSSQTGDLGELTRMLQAGAAVNAVDTDGSSALIWAASRRDTRMVRLLTSRGADPGIGEVTSPKGEVLGQSTSSFRKSEGMRKTGSMFRRSGSAWLRNARLSAQASAIQEVLRDALKANRLMLHSAREGDWTAMAKAIDHGAWIEIPDKAQRSPLSHTASQGGVEGARLLLQARATVHSKDWSGWTPLHWAAAANPGEAKHAEVASLLHHAGADVLTRTFSGDTPQHLAAKSGNVLMLMVLRSAGAHLEAKDVEDHTVLQVSATRGNAASVQCLLFLKADANVRDAGGRSLVALAAMHGQHALLQELLDDELADKPIKPTESRNDEARGPMVGIGATVAALQGDKGKLSVPAKKKNGSQSKSNWKHQKGKPSDSTSRSAMSTVSEDSFHPTSRRSSKREAAKAEVRHSKEAAAQEETVELHETEYRIEVTQAGEEKARPAGRSSLLATGGGGTLEAPDGSPLDPDFLTPPASPSPSSPASPAASSRKGQWRKQKEIPDATLDSVRSKRSEFEDDAYSVLSDDTALSGSSPKTNRQGRGKKKKTRPVINGEPVEVIPPDLKLFKEAEKLTNRLVMDKELSSKEALLQEDAEGCRPLAVAVKALQQNAVAVLLYKKADVNARDNEGNTALVIAAASWSAKLSVLEPRCQPRAIRIVELLLAAKADTEARNTEGLGASDLAKDATVRALIEKNLARAQVKSHLSKSHSASTLGSRRTSALAATRSDSSKTEEQETTLSGWRPHSASRVRLESLPRHLPKEVLEDGIKILIKESRIPPPSKVEVVVHPITGVPVGHAYVDYTDDEEADFLASHEQLIGKKKGLLQGGTVQLLRERSLSINKSFSLPSLTTLQ